MEKRIDYTGVTAAPSDYLCADGQLAAAMNLVYEDGSLSPAGIPEDVFSLAPGQDVIHIHRTATYEHYIILHGRLLYWRTKDNAELHTIVESEADIKSVNTIGNTLVVFTTESIEYYLWKDTGYTYLGNKMPEMLLSFGLKNHFYNNVKVYDGTSTTLKLPRSFKLSDKYTTNFEQNNEYLWNKALATINKALAEAEEKLGGGRFFFPFLIRYAYRLYDGTLAMHSAPVLILPSAGNSPIVRVTRFAGSEDTVTDVEMGVEFSACSLDFRSMIKQETYELIKQWGDIIKSVDIFVSAPIYTYDQSLSSYFGTTFVKEGASASFPANATTYTVSKLENVSDKQTNYKAYYQKESYHNLTWLAKENDEHSPSEIQISLDLLNIRYKDAKDVIQQIRDCGLFYFLKSYEIGEMDPSSFISDTYEITYKDVDIPEGYLASLVTREVMTDDYKSHNTRTAENSFVYNSRLNLSGISEIPFEGFDRAGAQQRSNGYMLANDFNDFTDMTNAGETMYYYYTWVFIKKEGKNIVRKTKDWMSIFSDCPRYFFYPDTAAYRMVVECVDNVNFTTSYLDINLKPHATLNGAVYFAGFEDTQFTLKKPEGLVETTDNSIPLPNVVYTSDVNNPFYFPPLGVSTVGTGEILGMSSAVKALSQGQFGQFPLYVFSTDGVWAMQVSDTGQYYTVQPVTRDVCNNKDSITQIDTAVLFATDRGIMMLSGSETFPLTEMLDGTPVRIDDYPFINRLKKEFDVLIGFPQIIDCYSYTRDCRMAYDYKNQRIIAFNDKYSYHLIFSLKSKMWTMSMGTFTGTVNAYPDCYVMTQDNRLVNLSDVHKGNDMHCLVLTRPFKFDAPDIHKTVTRLLQKGNFDRNHIQQVLYGSNDLKNWQTVASSRNAILSGMHGTPYKYFRLLILAGLDQYESISSFTATIEPRQTNKIR